MKSDYRNVGKAPNAKRAPSARRLERAAKKDGLGRNAGPQAAPNLDYNRSPFSIIEAVLSPSGAPVLGLHLHVAHMHLLHTFAQRLGHREVTPNWIGILALVECHPGISQIALAKLIRLERASVGDRVARCISTGLIRRDDSPHDRRKYALHLTARGRRILQRLRVQIPEHENEFAAQLSLEERVTLIGLLDKLVPTWADSEVD